MHHLDQRRPGRSRGPSPRAPRRRRRGGIGDLFNACGDRDQRRRFRSSERAEDAAGRSRDRQRLEDGPGGGGGGTSRSRRLRGDPTRRSSGRRGPGAANAPPLRGGGTTITSGPAWTSRTRTRTGCSRRGRGTRAGGPGEETESARGGARGGARLEKWANKDGLWRLWLTATAATTTLATSRGRNGRGEGGGYAASGRAVADESSPMGW